MSNEQLPELWPGWETVRVIGHGSFGAVYEIRRDVFGETERSALKVISIPQHESEIESLYDSGMDQESVTATFKDYLQDITDEYKLMRRLSGNTNIVNCDDLRYIQHDDGIGWDIYIKMELLTPMEKLGESVLNEDGVISLGMDMCRALMLCEKEHIVHRDIKPANIFVSDKGSFKLGDFGIAKTMEHTSGGTKTGTYDFMAPEVYNNKPYGTQADIYSLGMVMYRMLNNRRGPFMPQETKTITVRDRDAARKLRFDGEKLPEPVNGSEGLKRVVLKACEFDTSRRWRTADEMYAALEKLLSGESPEDETDRTVVDPDGEKKQKRREKKDGSKKNLKDVIVWLLAAAVVIGGLLFAAAKIGLLPGAKGSGRNEKIDYIGDSDPTGCDRMFLSDFERTFIKSLGIDEWPKTARVEMELDSLSKYEGAYFDNIILENLANKYLNALQAQKDNLVFREDIDEYDAEDYLDWIKQNQYRFETADQLYKEFGAFGAYKEEAELFEKTAEWYNRKYVIDGIVAEQLWGKAYPITGEVSYSFTNITEYVLGFQLDIGFNMPDGETVWESHTVNDIKPGDTITVRADSIPAGTVTWEKDYILRQCVADGVSLLTELCDKSY